MWGMHELLPCQQAVRARVEKVVMMAASGYSKSKKGCGFYLW